MSVESRPPVFGSSMSSSVLAQLAYLGIDEYIDRTPDIVAAVNDPFIFTGVITDNSTTPANLRLSASIPDKRLQSTLVAGIDSPDMMLYVSALKISFLAGAESATNLNSVLSTTYLEHTSGGVSRYVPLYGCAQLFPEVVALGGGDSTAAVAVTTRLGSLRRQPVELDDPLLIYFRPDVFQLAISAPVDLALNMPFVLELYGAAWAPSRGTLIQRVLSQAREAWARRARRAQIRGLLSAGGGPNRIPV